MDTAVQKGMTLAEFFPWAEAQNGRYEFDGAGPVEMTGGGRRHSRLQLRLLRTLADRLERTGWEVAGPDAGVRTIGDALRYPDVVVCPSGTSDEGYWFDDPVVVFELVSPSSGRIDRVVKRREYEAVATIQRYVILELDGNVTDLARGTDGRFVERLLGLGDVLEMPEIGVSLKLSELY